MNDRDSEEIAGMLLDKGYVLADSPEEALARRYSHTSQGHNMYTNNIK